MASPQTLTDSDRRVVAAWAADCAEHVLPLFARVAPGDERPLKLIERARAYACGEVDAADHIRRRFQGGVPAAELSDPVAKAAAQSAGQAAAVAHMGAHALGAAAYAVRAAELDDPVGRQSEIAWQMTKLTSQARHALRSLPLAGTNRSGPLGSGLLTSGAVGSIVRELQERLTSG
jgi:hypothetical protein